MNAMRSQTALPNVFRGRSADSTLIELMVVMTIFLVVEPTAYLVEGC
jgi:hypothetical protein